MNLKIFDSFNSNLLFSKGENSKNSNSQNKHILIIILNRTEFKIG